MEDSEKTKEQLLAELQELRLKNSTCETNLSASRMTEMFLDDIIEKNPLSIQIVDKDGFTIRVNEAHAKLFNAIPPETYSIFTDPQFIEQGLDVDFERLRKGEVINIAHSTFNTSRVKEGFPDVKLWIHSVSFPIFDNDGIPERYVIMHENSTERKLAEEKLNRLNEELRTLKENIKHSIEESKKSLSQELHDNVLQDMAGNCFKLDGVSAEVSSEGLRSELNAITADLRRLLDITRDIITTLRPEMVEIHGIGTAIIHLAENFSKKNQIELKLDVNSGMQLPGNVSLQLYRILQEALTNILKHTKASAVSISLKKNKKDYNLIISDNGQGFADEDPITKSSLGIIIMKDRAASLGGSFDLKSKKDSGTTITISLPLTIENL